MTTTHNGTCFCGSVEIEVSGTPEGMGYCHLRVLPRVVGRTGERVQPLETGKRADHRRTGSDRRICRRPELGAPVLQKLWRTHHDGSPEWGVTDVFAAAIPSLVFEPGVHVNYAETVLPMRDGLPKFKDFPAEIGGSGEQVAE
jgi:hypothetical protein